MERVITNLTIVDGRRLKSKPKIEERLQNDYIHADAETHLIPMAVTAYASGTKKSEIGVEQTLSAPSEPGTYQLEIDCSVLAALDVLELRIYNRVLSAGTLRVFYYMNYQGAQPADDMGKVSVPVSNDLSESEALKFTLKQTAGSPREFPWKVLRFA